MSESLLQCEALQVGYGGRAILPPIDMTIGAGQFWAVIGRNGAGKTTWFRTLLGLQRTIAGTIHRSPDLRLSHIPQRATFDDLFPVRARDVVRMGVDRGASFLWPRFGRTPPAVRRALDDVGAEGLARQRFSALSEGQKQRVLLARLVASAPHVALLDEPMAAMDRVAEREAFGLIDGLRRQHGMAVVVVSHHLQVAGEFADCMLLVDRNQNTAMAGAPGDIFESDAFLRSYGDGAGNAAEMSLA